MKKRYVIGCIGFILIAVVSYFLFQVALDNAVDLVEVPFAKKTLYAHQMIQEEDIEMREVPRVYVQSDVILKREDIAGKYVDLSSKIPKGSLFYEDFLVSDEEIKDLPSLLLKEGQMAYPIKVDLLKSSGATLHVNQHVDIYMTYASKVNKVKVTTVECLIRNARIINVKDRNGLNVGEEDAKSVPSIVILAIQLEQVDLLRKAQEIGELDIYAPRSEYSVEEEAVLNEESTLLQVLKDE
ncbi:MAG: hypothetical protein IKL88_08555 [Erysipelotrichales bacterium]|nr:hypothetical protein [Erysipelotrichales bacterium]